MARATVDLELTRGDDVTRTFAWKDDQGVAINITGWTFRAQIRTLPGAGTAWPFTITTDGVTGMVTLAMAHTVTATIPAGRAWWDLEKTVAGQVDTPLGGAVTVWPDVTR